MTQEVVELQEWDTATLAGRQLAPASSAHRMARALAQSGRLDVLELARGLELRSTSWVGRVALDDLTITIGPKIPGLPLLNLLRYAYGLRDLHLIGEAAFGTRSGSFQDLLIAQLVAEVSELLARGLHRDYRRTQTTLASPRGRLDFPRYVTTAGSAEATLPCVYHPRTEQTPLNQAVLAGLGVATRLTGDLALRVRLRRLGAMFDLGGPAPRIDRDRLTRVLRDIDRRTSHYRPALTLIHLMLRGEALSLEDANAELRLDGFLFDMNAFFQALLSRFLREHLLDVEILDEHRLHGAFVYDADHNPLNRCGLVPRPDFLVRQHRRTLAVLDAKYRDLWARNVPRDMLYQLAIYALTLGAEAPVAVILYPTLTETAQDQVVIFQDVLRARAQARVVLRPVNLLDLDDRLKAGNGIDAVRRRAVLARRLVGLEGGRTSHGGLS